MPLILDIETANLQATSETQQFFRDTITVPGNYKKPEAIEKYKEEKLQELISKSALQVAVCPISCIGLMPYYGAGQYGDPVAFSGLKEADTLSRTRHYLLQLETDHPKRISDGHPTADRVSPILPWMGFNILNFDLPVIRAACFRHKTNLGADIIGNGSKYNTRLALDLVNVLPGTYSKNVYCDLWDIEHDDTLTGADMPELYRLGDFETIERHCIDDLVATAKLFDMVASLSEGGLYAIG